MESDDLTVLFITANLLPKSWQMFHMEKLDEAIMGRFPLFVVARNPDINPDILETYPKTPSNIYRQMMFAAEKIKTPYIAVVEDDTLYHPTHFDFRPPKDIFAYNTHRWSIFTWGTPTFSVKTRISNCSLIASRDLMLEALEERFRKYPDELRVVGELGKERTEKSLGVTVRKRMDFQSEHPIVQFNHDFASEEIQRTHKKKRGIFRAYEIPYWGKADELVQNFV